MVHQQKSASVAVKICGLTTVGDSSYCRRLGLAYVGYNFYPGSKRFIAPAAAAATWSAAAAQVPAAPTQAVGVVVRPTLASLELILASFPGLNAIQMHGEDGAHAAEIRAFLTKRGLFLWRAVHVHTAADVTAAAALAGGVDLVLFDSAAVPAGQDVAGGSGESFAWSALTSYPPALPYGVAGGLNPNNIAALAAALRPGRPALIDICSGVERSPGRKDHGLIAASLQAVQAVW